MEGRGGEGRIVCDGGEGRGGVIEGRGGVLEGRERVIHEMGGEEWK